MARFRNTAWVQLISIDVAESLERTRQSNKMEGNDKNNQNIEENEKDECTNALDDELDEADKIQLDNGNEFVAQYKKLEPNAYITVIQNPRSRSLIQKWSSYKKYFFYAFGSSLHHIF